MFHSMHIICIIRWLEILPMLSWRSCPITIPTKFQNRSLDAHTLYDIYITFERVNYKTHYTIHVVTCTITTLICNFIDIIATCCRVSQRCQPNVQNVPYTTHVIPPRKVCNSCFDRYRIILNEWRKRQVEMVFWPRGINTTKQIK